jgi:hypothetical protein
VTVIHYLQFYPLHVLVYCVTGKKSDCIPGESNVLYTEEIQVECVNVISPINLTLDRPKAFDLAINEKRFTMFKVIVLVCTVPKWSQFGL